MTGFLILATVFLVAGVIAVPIAMRLGLGSVLGYLIAGIAISPVLSALHVDVISIQHFAEFGVVMMLFLVGLELEPKMLWDMRRRLIGLGGLQVSVIVIAVMLAAMALGQPWTIGLACGMVLALSSTAIVMQTLGEKGLTKSDGGQAGFSVLLFQDIAAIPMLAVIPLLALPELAHHAADAAHSTGSDHGTSFSLVEGRAGWQVGIITFAAIGGVIAAGAFLTGPLFRFIAAANLRELFVATALMFVIGIALLMTLVGLSPALGTFIAGVVLANSEYRHELESDINPFRGLLLGLFFMTVGAGVNFDLLSAEFAPIIGMTIGLILLKALVLLALARLFKVSGADKWLFGLGLSQAGEFGFVLLSFTVANNVLPQDISDRLLLVVALSMMLTPALFMVYERLIVPRYIVEEEREADEIESHGNVIIAGHGRFGGIVNRMLRSAGIETTVLDYSSSQLNMLKRFGVRAFYGDATRADLLHAAGLETARLLVVAIDNRHAATELVRLARNTHPELHIVARAVDRTHVYELYQAGANDMIRETFDSSVRAGRSAFEALGMHPFVAEKFCEAFVKDDRSVLRELADLYTPEAALDLDSPYIARAKELMTQQGAQLTGRGRAFRERSDRGWMPPMPQSNGESAKS